MTSHIKIPVKFKPVIDQLLDLQKIDRYQGVIIFGSLARGDSNDHSDVDVNIIINEDNECEKVNHPYINKIKLDLNILSLKQFNTKMDRQIKKHERIPWIAEALILFDKTGELKKLQQEAKKIKPLKIKSKEYPWINFLIYNVNAKVERYIHDQPEQALFVMTTELSYLLRIYYQLKGRWWVSNKRLLTQLAQTDTQLANYIKKFMSAPEIKSKYNYWQKIVAYISHPLGGLKPLIEKNCQCKTCKLDLVNFS